MSRSEFNLAVACCRASFAGDDAEEIRRLSGVVDWGAFLHLVRRHRVQRLVAQAFHAAGVSPPGAIGSAIEADCRSIAQQNLRAAVESIRVLESFERRAIPLLFVKGLSLSALAYGDPFLKMSSDVDLLVPLADVGRAAAELGDLGYHVVVPQGVGPVDIAAWHRSRKESVWYRADGDVTLELHTRLADNPALVPGIGMSSPAQDVAIGLGRSIPTLNTDDLFTYLCVHGASSAWFRLKWIVDLAALLHQIGADQAARLYRAAQAQGAGKAAAQALLLADSLDLLSLPERLRGELDRDRTAMLLARIALRELRQSAEPTERRLGTALIHLSGPLLLDGWRLKVSEAKRQLRDVLVRGR